MRPVDTLMEEHRVIEQVLNCLECMADRCETGDATRCRVGRRCD